MKRKEIYNKYNKYIHPCKGKGSYVNIIIIKDIITDLYSNGYIVCGYEFLRIFEKGTQPFMDYSLWKDKGYNKNELLMELDNLNKIITDKGFKEKEIYFDILIKK